MARGSVCQELCPPEQPLWVQRLWGESGQGPRWEGVAFSCTFCFSFPLKGFLCREGNWKLQGEHTSKLWPIYQHGHSTPLQCSPRMMSPTAIGGPECESWVWEETREHSEAAALMIPIFGTWEVIFAEMLEQEGEIHGDKRTLRLEDSFFLFHRWTALGQNCGGRTFGQSFNGSASSLFWSHSRDRNSKSRECAFK